MVKKIFKVLVLLLTLCIVSFVIVYKLFPGVFYKKMQTKQIKIEDIKSINVLSFNPKRRVIYEKNLRNKLGEYFLGHKIGDDIRLKNICNGKKDLFAENMINGNKVTFEDVKTRDGFSTFRDGIWKICSKNNSNECVYYSNTLQNYIIGKIQYKDNKVFNVFGCFFSHIRAIEKIAKQPDNTYGLIFEDDFDISDNFNEDMNNVLNAVPKDFDLLKLSLKAISLIVKKNKKLPLSAKIKHKNYKKNGYGNWIDLSIQDKMIGNLSIGTQAYLVSAQGARKILNSIRNNPLPCLVDIDIFYSIPTYDRNIRMYIYTGNVPFTLSDVSYESDVNERTINFSKK